MPTFDTPDPIVVVLDLAVATVRIVAGDRADTVVDIQPNNAGSDADVRDAEQTRVDLAGGRLTVRTPKLRSLFRKSGSIDLTIELPAGSQLRGDLPVGTVETQGRLGECRFKVAAGDVRLEHTGPLRLDASAGDAEIDRVDGRADVTTGSGSLRIGAVDGPATLKNSNGETRVGEVTGDLQIRTANGDIVVDRAHASVEAKTARGSVRIGEVARGSVTLSTSIGDLEVGIREGTAAWLDVSSTLGNVRNSLSPTEGPGESGDTVEVHARNSFGDIVIRRS